MRDANEDISMDVTAFGGALDRRRRPLARESSISETYLRCARRLNLQAQEIHPGGPVTYSPRSEICNTSKLKALQPEIKKPPLLPHDRPDLWPKREGEGRPGQRKVALARRRVRNPRGPRSRPRRCPRRQPSNRRARRPRTRRRHHHRAWRRFRRRPPAVFRRNHGPRRVRRP